MAKTIKFDMNNVSHSMNIIEINDDVDIEKFNENTNQSAECFKQLETECVESSNNAKNALSAVSDLPTIRGNISTNANNISALQRYKDIAVSAITVRPATNSDTSLANSDSNTYVVVPLGYVRWKCGSKLSLPTNKYGVVVPSDVNAVIVCGQANFKNVKFGKSISACIFADDTTITTGTTKMPATSISYTPKTESQSVITKITKSKKTVSGSSVLTDITPTSKSITYVTGGTLSASTSDCVVNIAPTLITGVAGKTITIKVKSSDGSGLASYAGTMLTVIAVS